MQAGKFATVFGNWTPRHLSWDNPFINAPLPYENITSAADLAAPAAGGRSLFFRAFPASKYTWVPVIWGPSYATGAAVAGQVAEHFDFAVRSQECRAFLASGAMGRDHARLEPSDVHADDWAGGPAPEWNLGVSGSEGAYMTDGAASTLPPGDGVGDYRQITFGQDAAYAHGHWQVWAEAFESRFEVPNAGNADTFAYYVETKLSARRPSSGPGCAGTSSFSATMPDGRGGEQVWGNDLWRTDLVVGCRLSEHFQAKAQYSYGREHDPGGERNPQVGCGADHHESFDPLGTRAFHPKRPRAILQPIGQRQAKAG